MAARTLGQIGLPSAAEPLILALGDPDDSVVPAVAQAIGLVKAAGATEGLIRALGRGDVSARTAAAWALGQTRGTGGIPALLNCSATSIHSLPAGRRSNRKNSC
jgi:HEAT repeat protein